MSVYLQITSQNILTEKRFDKGLDLLTFKEKLEPITGIPAGQQVLTLYRGESPIQQLAPFPGHSDDSVMLGAFQVEDGSRIHVTELSGSTQRQVQYQDVSLIEKFEISEQEYDQRQDSVRAFKQRNQLGRFAPEAIAAKEAYSPLGNDSAAPPSGISIGDRCQVSPPPGHSSMDALFHRGTVRYIGLTGFQPGYWIGIEYDEPYGKNNGSVNGEYYFSCQPKYGVFVRPDRIQVGDFPPESLDLDEL
ncbi:hypothetical protein DSO57_1017653 [Entomophthora muscae]|uniref:Uncharacterized protein n=1 Tax=Entomophthora muscae TaxID=34485 RepID=A0ACC2TS49_9FUNG|nr:hypothetical protein DSO57_1017653 [Entomophthora muscae]